MTSRDVLVVDDHRDMAEGIAMLLREVRLDVEVARSARDALTRLEEREFALVLSDVRMPRMSGVALLAEIKRRWPRTRVVLLTAYGSIDSAVGAMKEGANDYLTKPFENTALIEVVQRNLAAARSADAFDASAIVAAVAARLSPDDLLGSLTRALETLRNAVGADDCELFLCEPEGRDALLTTCVGLDSEALIERTRFSPGSGYPGIVTATGASLAIRGALVDDPRYLRRAVIERGICSYACAPLLEPRAPFGSVHLLSRRGDFPIDQAVVLLEQVAVSIASAVRAGLAVLRQAVDETSAPHATGSPEQIRALLACICGVANASYGTLALVDPETGLPARVVSTGPPNLLCASAESGTWPECPSAILHGHGFSTPPGRRMWPMPCRRGVPQRVVSPCCLPLVGNGRFYGMVTLDLRHRTEGPATSRLVPLLAMAQQTVLHLSKSHPGMPVERGGGNGAAGDRATPELEVRCLGPFALLRRGIPIPAEQFPRSRALGLLKLLALNAGTPLTKDYLIDRLWPETDPVSGANRLHGVVHALRSVIEPPRSASRYWLYVRNRGDLYYLDLEGPISVDLLRYRALAKQGLRAVSTAPSEAVVALEEAAALYRGELFADDPYAEWCDAERRELAELQTVVLETLAALYGRHGDGDRALELLRRAVRSAPYREDLVLSLLEQLVRLERPAEAHAQYEDFARTLEQELGTGPGRPLQEFRLRVLGA